MKGVFSLAKNGRLPEPPRRLTRDFSRCRVTMNKGTNRKRRDSFAEKSTIHEGFSKGPLDVCIVVLSAIRIEIAAGSF
ncbi:hypothetical protein CEXT_350831 [Caerostris extrusa]|uniref:Uncharacterized protein n=1 Tax=Caerostris extrusa TaxID=172846 RepID=A0AAV4VZ70_CAEEX|nr:hypothetical protein CEXT_350831 [Caerostris extrusa]